MVYLRTHAHVIELVPYTWTSPEYAKLAKLMHLRYQHWRNSHVERHHDPIGCPAASAMPWRGLFGLQICRGSRSDETNVNMDEINVLVRRSIADITQHNLQTD